MFHWNLFKAYLCEFLVDLVYPHLLPPAFVLYAVEPIAQAVEPIKELGAKSGDVAGSTTQI